MDYRTEKTSFVSLIEYKKKKKNTIFKNRKAISLVFKDSYQFKVP